MTQEKKTNTNNTLNKANKYEAYIFTSHIDGNTTYVCFVFDVNKSYKTTHIGAHIHTHQTHLLQREGTSLYK
jgi:hypothetical protein